LNLGAALHHKGHFDMAIAVYRQALALNEKDPKIHNNLGISLVEKGLLDEAIKEHRKAIELKRDFPEAHSGLGYALLTNGQLDDAIRACSEAIRLNMGLQDQDVHRILGNALERKGLLDEAIVEYRKAIRLKPRSTAHHAATHNNLGLALLDKGLKDEAIEMLRAAAQFQNDASNHVNLGSALADSGRLDEAIAAYRDALQIDEKHPLIHLNLGIALAGKGQLDEAIKAYREAIRLKNDLAKAHGNLGFALLEKGQIGQALEALRCGGEESRRLAEQLARMGNRLPDLLKGKTLPRDAPESLVLAQLWEQSGKFAAAARLYGEALTRDSTLATDIQAAHRYSAACAAARAAAGHRLDSAGLDEKERTRLRMQARDWLRADLEAWGRLLQKDSEKARREVSRQMQHWLQDTDFTGVRGPDALDRLPEGERAAWQRLWEEVETLRRQAATPPKAPPGP
jgi:tetratricopeptide (TPR) repeat protein